MPFTLTLRALSGQSKELPNVRPNEKLSSLVSRAAQEFDVFVCEVQLLHGVKMFTQQEYSATLESLEITADTELVFIRLPRMTLELLEGDWVNSKGAKIISKGDRVFVSGLVSYTVSVDENGTVISIGDNLHVRGLSGVDIIKFEEDTWWRVRKDDYHFAVMLRTVGGLTRRIEGLSPGDSLSSLREIANKELADIIVGGISRSNELQLGFCSERKWLTQNQDELTLRELGISDGTSLLCCR
eukprot:gnl/TRDRNA2_/TRDRNA2_197646_c0_seq1.p1 gnl/TRDRNA2_/TRDRNA2_197646_c0~~gnl/TRDRNA2_/TRDRNA2_197646_c0_seq1.p1  ORF type:complete len:242 (+),score=41.70 gnl/TRDRNA2_/TRDRNA2_197646_c0_seq1:79-804(+)